MSPSSWPPAARVSRRASAGARSASPAAASCARRFLLSYTFPTLCRDLRRTGSAGVLAILLSTLATVLTGGTLLAERAVAGQVAAWRAEVRLVAVLRERPARADEPERAVALARALPGVAALRYVSPEAALAALRRHLGPSVDGLDRLPANPLPARLEVTPAGHLDAAGLQALVADLGRLPAVEEVQAALGWVGPAERLLRGVRRGGRALAFFVGLAAFLAVAGGTAAARRDRADETAILRLAGVGEATLRGPLVGQAVVLGGAGAALGICVLVLLTEAATPWLGGALRASLGLGPLPAPAWPLQAGLLGGGLLVGLLGGLAGGRP